MKNNVGKFDKTMRIIVGVAIVGAGLYFETWWGTVGAIPLLTGSIGWCPIYAPFGLSSCSRK